jgi:hypothetical protein
MPIEPPVGEDRGVHADHLALHVEERAARVAAVDRGVGLDEVVVGALERAVARRDDARGDREALAERVADRHHPVADAGGVGVAEGHVGQGALGSTLRSAMSVRGSRPMMRASSSSPE